MKSADVESVAKWFERFIISDEVFIAVAGSDSWLPACLKDAIAQAMIENPAGWKDCEPTPEESLEAALAYLEEEWNWR